MVDYWKRRWLNQRKQNLAILNKVLNFKPTNFEIT